MEWSIVPDLFALVVVAILAILTKKRGGTGEFTYDLNPAILDREQKPDD
jgi:hypothetical protein